MKPWILHFIIATLIAAILTSGCSGVSPGSWQAGNFTTPTGLQNLTAVTGHQPQTLFFPVHSLRYSSECQTKYCKVTLEASDRLPDSEIPDVADKNGTLTSRVSSVLWTPLENLSGLDSADREFQTEADDNSSGTIIFGDAAEGNRPQNGDESGYLWDFGDGTTGTGRIVTHAFRGTGPYLIRLSVLNDTGNRTGYAAVLTGDGRKFSAAGIIRENRIPNVGPELIATTPGAVTVHAKPTIMRTTAQAIVRKDPYHQFRYRLMIDGEPRAGFHEVEFADLTTDVVEYPVTLRTNYGNILLKWGITYSSDLYNWRIQVISRGSESAKKDVSILRFDDLGREAARWDIYNAWPNKYDPPDFNPKGNEMAIERLEIVHEGCRRVS